MSDTQFDDEILDSNAISPTDEEGNPVPVTIPIALAPGVTVVYTTRLGGVSHGDFGDCNLGGKGGDFIGAKEQLSILQIVPAPVEPDPEAPGGAAVIFRRGKLDLHADGAKTYTNRATEFFIRACHFPHRSRAAFGVGAVGATALRASQHTLSMFSAASGASLSIKKVATIRFFAVS